MLNFTVGPYKYTVKKINNGDLNISALNTETFYKWKRFCRSDDPVPPVLPSEELYTLLQDYSENKQRPLVSFDFPKTNIKAAGILKLKIIFKIQSWNGSYDDPKNIDLYYHPTTKEVRLMKSVESKLNDLNLLKLSKDLSELNTNEYNPDVFAIINKKYPLGSNKRNDLEDVFAQIGYENNQISLLSLQIIEDLLIYSTKHVAVIIGKTLLKADTK